jgi:hypothetical protein
MAVKPRAAAVATALGLAVALAAVYWWSMPPWFYVQSASGNSLARVLGKAPYFESDGAFILRQFRQQRSFTHNDHVLYHVLATALPRSSGESSDPVRSHVLVSVVAGAAGAAVLVLAGYRLSGRLLPSLLAACLVAGSASYWYFAATIDTYAPAVLASILTLQLALLCAERQQLVMYVAMGAAAGATFLFRTDAVLLAPLVLVALGATTNRLVRVTCCGAAAALVGAGGYALVAHYAYGVRFPDVWTWATASLHRPEATLGVWASATNVTAGTLWLTAVNHLVYSVMLPALDATRESDLVRAMAASRTGAVAFVVYCAFAMVVVARLAALIIRRATRGASILLLVVGGAWAVTRIVFYTWWNPHDPFLFAITSLPALWLVCLVAFRDAGRPRRAWEPGDGLMLGSLAAVVSLVWWHNFEVLVRPLWHMPVPH